LELGEKRVKIGVRPPGCEKQKAKGKIEILQGGGRDLWQSGER